MVPVPGQLGEEIRTSVPEVDKVIRYAPFRGDFKVGNELFRAFVGAVDPEFFEVFTFSMQEGSSLSIQDMRSIFINEELKEKYFPGQADVIGESLTFIYGERRIDFRIGGVFAKPPQNTSFSQQAYVHYDNVTDLEGIKPDNWAAFNSTFVTIDDPSNLAAVERQLQNYVEIQNRAKEDYKVDHFYLDPFVGMAVRSEKEDIWNHWFDSSLPTAAAVAPAIMAFLILLIACFNFTNTSIAIANRRIKEIGIRKVLGSNKKQLIAQFLGENVLLSILALFAGILIAAFLVPAYSAMWPFLDIKLDLLSNVDLLVFLSSIVALYGPAGRKLSRPLCE